MRVLGTTIKFLALGCVLILVAPGVNAALTFDNEYENQEQYVDWDVSEAGNNKINMWDMVDINNYNQTIKPLADSDARFRGITQYPFSIPHKYLLNHTDAGTGLFVGKNMTFAWLFRPDKSITFGSASEVWVRLPINNLSLSRVRDMRFAAWKLYSDDEYNLSLGTTIADSFLSPTRYSTVPYREVYNTTLYSAVTTVTPGLPFGNLVNATHQHTAWANWTYDGVNNSIEYNFTWVRINAVFDTNVPYLLLFQLTSWGFVGETIEYEVLWSESDMNKDGVLLSHLNINGTQHNVSVDYDTPVIITDLASHETYSIGFLGDLPIDDVRYRFSFFHPAPSYTAGHHITVQLPFYSLVGCNVSVTIGVAGHWSGAASIAAPETFTVRPGPNILTFNRTFGADLATFGRLDIHIVTLNGSAPYIGFLLNHEANGVTTIMQDGGSFDHFFRLRGVTVLRYFISAAQVAYVPLEQYSIYVVPDPYDLEASIAYVEEARRIEQDLLLRFDTTDEGWGWQEWLTVALVAALLVVSVVTFGFGAGVAFFVIGVLSAFALRHYVGRLLSWMANGVAFLAVSLAKFYHVLVGIIEFVVHALSWIVTHALHLLALWSVISVYLLGTYAANGICNAFTSSRRRRRHGRILNLGVFDDVIDEAFSKYMRLLTLNMSIIGGVCGITLVVLRMVSPI